MDIPVLEQLKNYFADRPETAMLALCVMTIAFLFNKLQSEKAALLAEKDSHRATVMQWLPVAEKMSNMLSVMATKTTRSRKESPPAVPAISSPEGKNNGGKD